jgi:hypothetical protein
LFRGDGKKNKKGKVIKGKSFVLSHFYKVLEKQEKWKNRKVLEVPKIAKATIIDGDDDEVSSDGVKRSPTPNLLAKTKIPIGVKQAKEKGKKSGDDNINKAIDAILSARKEANEERRMCRDKESALEERRAAAEERRLALEEKKVAMEENARIMEQEKKLFVADTYNLDERQKEYINMCRDEVLAKKRMMTKMMSGFGGMSAPMGGYGGMGATPRGFGGMGATPEALEAWEQLWEALEAMEQPREALEPMSAWVRLWELLEATSAWVATEGWEAWEHHLRVTLEA